jgi:integrase
MIYYNRRVPKHAVSAYGSYIRIALSKGYDQAADYEKRLSNVLASSWSSPQVIHAVDLEKVIASFQPCSFILSEVTGEYLELKNIEAKPVWIAVNTLISLAGDKDTSAYDRQDAKLFLRHLELKGNKSGTIRRRIVSVSAVFNYAFAELDLEKRNPFSRLIIRNEGQDRHKRRVFTNEQLKVGYDKAISSGSDIKLIFPILGETGCRLAEVVGLRVEDIDLDNQLIHIRPNPARRLKTRQSTRTLPLVGYALQAVELALAKADGEWLFPRYIKDGKCKADHASAALNKWVKKDFGGLTAHSLRHTMRDRLRAIECPAEMIDQIGGWARVGIGAGYGEGYSVISQVKWLIKMSINFSRS